MIQVDIKNLENIFQNTQIRFQKENLKSNEVYLDLLLDEIQNYFNNLNTYQFDENKVFIPKDNILTLKRYLYGLTTVSNNIDILYKKIDEIVSELNKLINLNIYERTTILNKLEKIHNYVMSHTISSEQNVDFSFYYRENFNDASYMDMTDSIDTEVDNVAGVLKLKSTKKVKNVIDKDSLSLTLVNKDEILKNNKIFPSEKFSVGDIHGIEDKLYYEKSKDILLNNMFDYVLDNNVQVGDPTSSCPFELVFTNIAETYWTHDIRSVTSQILDKSESINGRIEINRNHSFLQKFLNNQEVVKLTPPEFILNISLLQPTFCNFIDISFDKLAPSIIDDNGFLKGNVYDDKGNEIKIINLNTSNNNLNFPTYRIFWGKLINVNKVELHFKSKWVDVPIKMLKWETSLKQNTNMYGGENINLRKLLYTEKFDSKVYYRETGETITPETMVKNLYNMAVLQHG